MDGSIFTILALDGVTSGAVYALLAMALVLVFSVTRVIFLPQGEFIGFGALTMAALQAGQFPRLVALLAGAGGAAFALELGVALWQRHLHRRTLRVRALAHSAVFCLLYPLALWWLAGALAWQQLPMLLQALFTLAVTVPLGVFIWRIAFEPLAEASVLVLLIVAVGVHFVLMGMGLFLFGPEGVMTRPFTSWSTTLGDVPLAGQGLAVVAVSVSVMALLSLLFTRTLWGKALRAAAISRTGAHLVGIGTAQAGRVAFGLAAALGTLAGLLIAPLNAVAYDTGFLLALKGFVAAVVGALVSYPLAAAGALLVGLLESYASFWASAYKEVIVFTLVIPVLAWLSFKGHHGGHHGDGA